MKDLSFESVDLIVTSPPYPMIEMWYDLFSFQSSLVKKQLKKENLILKQTKKLLISKPLRSEIIEENLSIVNYSSIAQQEVCSQDI